MSTVKKNKISVLNWMGTLLLCAIPGVNVLAVILFLIFAKSPSKRSFAVAMLLWMLLLAVGIAAVMLALPEQVAWLSDWLRNYAANPVLFQ